MIKNKIKICEICGKEFTYKRKEVKTCSSKCSHILAARTTKERGKCFKRIYSINDNFFNVESNEKYYLLGLFASDGNVCNLNNTISISQSGDNGKLLVEYIKNTLQAENPILIEHPKNGKPSYSLHFRSKKILDIFKENNIIQAKSLIYQIPKYIIEDENKLRYFLIGYIDGDGCIGIYDSYLIINFVCSFPMVEQLRNLSFFEKARYSSKKSIGEFRFNGTNAVSFGNWLYDDIRVFQSYKYNKFLDYMDNYYLNSSVIKYKTIREKIYKELEQDKDLNCSKYARENNLTFQYVCKVKSEWRIKNDSL